MTIEAAPPVPSAYPVRLDVQRPERQSRLTNFPLAIGDLIRFTLLIPHLIVLAFLSFAGVVLYFLATFGILFTGRYPEGFFRFIVGLERWSNNVSGYLYHLYDDYPAFTMDAKPYPLSFEVDYPATSSRLLNFPLLGLYIRMLILIPNLIVLWVFQIGMLIALFFVMFFILFKGSFPEGLHAFASGVLRWTARVNAYYFGLTDKYPPFSTR